MGAANAGLSRLRALCGRAAWRGVACAIAGAGFFLAVRGEASACTAPPSKDSCAGKSDGWYCSELVGLGSYQCRGQSIVLGSSCPSGRVCVRSGSDGRAALASDGFPQCAVATPSAPDPSAPPKRGALNDWACKPTRERPYPAVVVHGQAGNFAGMRAITDRLVNEGYCVFATDYGYVPGGANGQDRLAVSSKQIGDFVDRVLQSTCAAKVDTVGHSAGTGVLDHFILKRGGAGKVRRVVSFGGLHHPYAHAGIPKFADVSLFLPNLTAAARTVVPGFTIRQTVEVALGLYARAGSPFGPVPAGPLATVVSGFTEDLFDPTYWRDLHGALSEVPGTFATFGGSRRSLLTNDAASSVCYTNMVAPTDLLAGAAAGFQDEATNVENVLLPSPLGPDAHVTMISEPVALARMMTGLDTPCSGGGMKTPISTGGVSPLDAPTTVAGADQVREAESAFYDAVRERAAVEGLPTADALADPNGAGANGSSGGCSASGSSDAGHVSSAVAVAGMVVAFGAHLRRARRRNDTPA